jgi:hypothetical protein
MHKNIYLLAHFFPFRTLTPFDFIEGSIRALFFFFFFLILILLNTSKFSMNQSMTMTLISPYPGYLLGSSAQPQRIVETNLSGSSSASLADKTNPLSPKGKLNDDAMEPSTPKRKPPSAPDTPSSSSAVKTPAKSALLRAAGEKDNDAEIVFPAGFEDKEKDTAEDEDNDGLGVELDREQFSRYGDKGGEYMQQPLLFECI